MVDSRVQKRVQQVALVCTAALIGMAFPSQAVASDALARALREPLTLMVRNVHLSDVARGISEQFDINIIIDNRAVRPAGDGEAPSDADDFATDGTIEAFSTRDTPLGDVLSQLIEPLGLTYEIQTNFIWISTPETIRHETFEELETRYFELGSRYIADVNAGVRPESEARIDMVALLRLLVPEIIDPKSHDPLSFMKYIDEKKQLVVHTTPTNHEIVASVLALVGAES